MDEEPAHRRFAAPEAVGETLAAMLLPSFEIDVAVVGQRGDEIIAVPNGPFRELFRARGVQNDLAQRDMTWRGHEPVLLSPLPGAARPPLIYRTFVTKPPVMTVR